MPKFLFALLLLAFSPALALADMGLPFDTSETIRLGYTACATSPLSGGLTAYKMTRTVKSPVTGQNVTETLTQVAGPDGRIFALSWSGIHHPDLSRLLPGRLPRVRIFRRGPSDLATPALVLHMSGTVLHSEGEAWDPSLVPPGVSPATLLPSLP